MTTVTNYQQQLANALKIGEQMEREADETVRLVNELIPGAKASRFQDAINIELPEGDITSRLHDDFAAAFARVDGRTPEGVL